MWACLKIVLWGESNLCCQISAVLFTWISSGSFEPLANTIQESATALSSRRNCEALPNSRCLQEWQEATRTPPEVLWCVFLSTKSWPMKISKEWQGKPMPHTITHHIYNLFKQHVFSQASTLAKYHISLFQAASRIKQCVCSQQNILLCICFIKIILS